MDQTLCLILPSTCYKEIVMRLLTLVFGLALLAGCFPREKCTLADGTTIDGLCPQDTGSDAPVDSADSGDTGEADSDSATDTDTSGDTGDSDPDSGDTDTDTDTDTGTGSVDGDIDGYNSDVDCDDHNEAVHPDATESCNGIDDNCDGVIDEGVEFTWYADGDSDGYGSVATSVEACVAPTGYVADATDCDDANPAVHPNAIESCTDGVDLNCDGSSGAADADGDGTIACEDCNDTEAAMYPGGTETCDGLDNDCDAIVDNDATDALTFYADVDGDSFGDSSNTEAACSASAGYVSDSTDCDDGNAWVNPSATEVCNDVDDNCDGGVDEAGADGEVTWYADGDSDGYGDAATTANACTAPFGYVASSSDCDDGDAAINPGASDIAGDRVDSDCDGSDGVADRDRDGDPYITDCDDANAAIYTGAPETCDGVDNDCDASVDEGVSNTYYADVDGDGYGDLTSSMEDCTMPPGYVLDTADCDDTRAWANPGIATDGDSSNDEYCWDTIDADCDGISGCWGGLTGSNLFGSMVLWNMEDPIGSGNVSGVTMVSGTAATSDCTTGNTDNCSAMLQGPGTWTVETDQSALSGSNMFCYVSLAADASSIPVTVSVYRGGTLLESVSHDTGTSWGPVSEFGLVAPASAGTITMQFTIASSNAVWVDALDCRQ